MRSFLRHLRGALVFAGFAINTILWFLPLFALALLKLLLPIPALRTRITRVLMAIGENWISVNKWLLGTFGSIDWRLDGGDRLRRGQE